MAARKCSTPRCNLPLVVVKDVTGCPVCDMAKHWPVVQKRTA